jgi:hypothetical protein
MQTEKRRIDKKISGATQVDRKTDKYAACQANTQSAKQAVGTGKNGITGNQANREADRQAGRQTEMTTKAREKDRAETVMQR